MDIKAFKQRFDPVFAGFLSKKTHGIESVTTDAFIRELTFYVERLLMEGGKRVRPYMAWLGYKAAGGSSETKIFQAGTGLELFHAFALVHDDIMDRGTDRHGIPTVHVHAAERMRELGRIGDVIRFGESQAILIGDLLFNWANEQLASTKAFPVFAKMIDEVIVGQMLDVDSMARRTVESEMIAERLRLKTATYTFVRPIQVGVALSSQQPKLMKFAETYGLPLGIGFQMQDDLLDLVTPAEVHGKTAFSDLHDGQHTVFTQYIFEHGTPEQARELRSLFGAHLTEKDRHRVIKLFEDSGAIEYGRGLIEQYFMKAEEAVLKSGMSQSKAEPFLELVAYIRGRSH